MMNGVPARGRRLESLNRTRTGTRGAAGSPVSCPAHAAARLPSLRAQSMVACVGGCGLNTGCISPRKTRRMYHPEIKPVCLGTSPVCIAQPGQSWPNRVTVRSNVQWRRYTTISGISKWPFSNMTFPCKTQGTILIAQPRDKRKAAAC